MVLAQPETRKRTAGSRVGNQAKKPSSAKVRNVDSDDEDEQVVGRATFPPGIVTFAPTKTKKRRNFQGTYNDLPEEAKTDAFKRLVFVLGTLKYNDIPAEDSALPPNVPKEHKRRGARRKLETVYDYIAWWWEADIENDETSELLWCSQQFSFDQCRLLLDQQHTRAALQGIISKNKVPPRLGLREALPPHNVKIVLDKSRAAHYRSPLLPLPQMPVFGGSASSRRLWALSRPQSVLANDVIRGDNVEVAPGGALTSMPNCTTLRNSIWYSDAIIEAATALHRADEIQKSLLDDEYRPKLIFSSVLVQTLQNALLRSNNGAQGLSDYATRVAARHLRAGVKVPEYHSIGMVVNINNAHWVNIYIYPNLRQIHGVNGFRKSTAIRQGVLPYIVVWLRAEYQACGVAFDDSEWTYMDVQNSPPQSGSTECGPIALTNMECWADDIDLDATEGDMSKWRQRQALCFSYGRILRGDPETRVPQPIRHDARSRAAAIAAARDLEHDIGDIHCIQFEE